MRNGRLQVFGERTLRTETYGDVTVGHGAVLWLRAPVHGHIVVAPGGRCHILAEVHGTVYVDRGIVRVDAPIHGGVRTSQSTPGRAVRRARAPQVDKTRHAQA